MIKNNPGGQARATQIDKRLHPYDKSVKVRCQAYVLNRVPRSGRPGQRGTGYEG